jgi:hypothetical protein
MAALGPLIAPGSRFLELLIDVQDWSFTTLRLLGVMQRVLDSLLVLVISNLSRGLLITML